MYLCDSSTGKYWFCYRSTLAGSSDFSGIWIAGHAELNVVQYLVHTTTGQGDNTTSGSDNDETSQGTIGGFAPTAGYEIGFNLPLGDTFFVTVGYADGGAGEAVNRNSKRCRNNDEWSLQLTVYLKASSRI